LAELRSALQEAPLFDPSTWWDKTLSKFKKKPGEQPPPEAKPGAHAAAPVAPIKKWVSAGGVILEPNDDTKVYVIKPSNNFGPWAFPKGKVDPGESMKQAALREVWEETGLRAKIRSGKAYLGKGTGRMSVTHYWLMIRTGGSPKQHGFETEKVLLVTWEHAIALFKRASNRRDVDIARRALKELGREEGPEHVLPRPPRHHPVRKPPMPAFSKWSKSAPLPFDKPWKAYAGLPLGGAKKVM
jgi:8-oxo-dGTP pyrophosphatase MutT (NUDIX family)